MKLLSPLSDRDRQRVSAAVERLGSTHAGFEAKLERFAQATRTVFSLETRLRDALAFKEVSPDMAARQDARRAELDAARRVAQTRKEEMEDARELAVDAIGRAGGLVREVAGCLVEQFNRGLAEALHPFCPDAAGAAAALPEHRTELPALHAFLGRGLHVSRAAGAAEVESLVFELSQTLRCLLDGGEVWQVRRAS